MNDSVVAANLERVTNEARRHGVNMRRGVLQSFVDYDPSYELVLAAFGYQISIMLDGEEGACDIDVVRLARYTDGRAFVFFRRQPRREDDDAALYGYGIVNAEGTQLHLMSINEVYDLSDEGDEPIRDAVRTIIAHLSEARYKLDRLATTS